MYIILCLALLQIRIIAGVKVYILNWCARVSNFSCFRCSR